MSDLGLVAAFIATIVLIALIGFWVVWDTKRQYRRLSPGEGGKR